MKSRLQCERPAIGLPVLACFAMVAVLLSSCGGEEKQPQKNSVRVVNITVQPAGMQDVDVSESVVGRILNPRSVVVSSEVTAKVKWVGVDVADSVVRNELLVRLDATDYQSAVLAARAEIARLTARIGAQKRLVGRYEKLARGKFVSPTMLDQAETQWAALKQERLAARDKYVQASLNLKRTGVRAPISGRVQRRMVAAGDYVRAGSPLVSIVAGGKLTISLPFPETRSGLIRPGQEVALTLPGGSRIVHTRIRELSPMVGRTSGAFEARMKIDNPGEWRPGGGVIADVLVAKHKNAVVVPAPAVVLRPKGEVVYVIRHGKAFEQVVNTGVHIGPNVEITRGLSAGTPVAVDGAAFLSNGATVHARTSSGKDASEADGT